MQFAALLLDQLETTQHQFVQHNPTATVLVKLKQGETLESIHEDFD